MTERDPHGLDPHAPGAKLDDGKAWVTTVLRGFWPVVRGRYQDRDDFDDFDAFFGQTREKAIRYLSALVTEGDILAAIQVGTFGARKYTRDGWLAVPDGVARYDEAAGRHLWSMLHGEECCPDSKLPHYYHFVWNVLACARLLADRATEEIPVDYVPDQHTPTDPHSAE